MKSARRPPQRFEHLLSPLRVGPRELRNRILISAHEIKMSVDGVPTEQYAAYHAARAAGGAGLQITGITPVHRTAAPGMTGMIRNTDDTVIAGYSRLATAVHAEGGTMLAQLGHSAATLKSHEPLAPAWSVSEVTGDLTRQIPHVMTRDEIHEVIDAHAAAARRVRLGDMDGVELLAAFGFLGAAFLSPLTNTRTDEYGGSPEGRLRFILELIEACRDALGVDHILGIRMPGDEKVDGGLTLQDMCEVSVRLQATGKVDYLNIAVGTNMDRIWRAEHWPPSPAPQGLYVALAAAVKEVVTLPVFAVGRIVDPDHAESIIAAGHADMVAMTRAHIADADLVAKLWDGAVDDIRPCVGANVCIRNGLEGRTVTCIHNPETSREWAWRVPNQTRSQRKVVVIGGGPAGMEAARVCASRGHRVELYEKSEGLGGQLTDWSKVPSMTEFANITRWQSRQLEKYQVRLHLSHGLTEDDIDTLEADVVVLATGSTPMLPAVGGLQSSSVGVVPAATVMNHPLSGIRRAVVWDHLGGGVGIGACEWLAESLDTVYLVTPHSAVGEDLDVTRRVPLYKRMMNKGVVFIDNTEIHALRGSSVVLRNVYTSEHSELEAIDLLVPSHGNTACNQLQKAIERRGIEVHVIGDALAPREMDLAFAEAAIVARRI